MSSTHWKRLFFNLFLLLSQFFFQSVLFSINKKKYKNPILFIISSGFIQYIFQSISILIPLYMFLNLHYFWSALLIICIEFSQYFKTPELLFNLWLNFNLNCFSITFFIFSFYCFSISTDFQSTLIELDFNLNCFSITCIIFSLYCFSMSTDFQSMLVNLISDSTGLQSQLIFNIYLHIFF